MLFDGFPTRKTYEINPLTVPNLPDVRFGGLYAQVPSFVYYGNLWLSSYKFTAMLVLFVPNIEISPAVHIAVRIAFNDTTSLMSLYSLIPQLINIPGFESFEFCQGALVMSSCSFQKMGYEVVGGLNLLSRIRVPPDSNLAELEPLLKPANEYAFNMRIVSGHAFEGDENGIIVEFQKDPTVQLNLFDSHLNITNIGILLDANNDRILGSRASFRFSKDLQMFGRFGANLVTRGALLDGVMSDIVLPPVIAKFFTVKRMTYTIPMTFGAGQLPDSFEASIDGTLKLGDAHIG